MKLIIDIPDNYKQRLDEDFDNLNTGSIGCTSILMAVKEGTPIPKNATNKDVLMTVFPDKKFTEGRFDGWFDEDVRCSLDWLNAPYKEGK